MKYSVTAIENDNHISFTDNLKRDKFLQWCKENNLYGTPFHHVKLVDEIVVIPKSKSFKKYISKIEEILNDF